MITLSLHTNIISELNVSDTTVFKFVLDMRRKRVYKAYTITREFLMTRITEDEPK